jgi:hypothetical protein
LFLECIECKKQLVNELERWFVLQQPEAISRRTKPVQYTKGSQQLSTDLLVTKMDHSDQPGRWDVFWFF